MGESVSTAAREMEDTCVIEGAEIMAAYRIAYEGNREKKRPVVVVLYHGKDVEGGNQRVMPQLHAQIQKLLFWFGYIIIYTYK